MKIDLGCGKSKKIDFIGIDIQDWSNIYPKGEFIQADLTKGIPFNDNEVDEIYTCDFLEHINHEEFISIIEEIHRVLKSEGKAMLLVPHFSGQTAFRPFHKLYFGVSSLVEFIHPKENSRWYKEPLFKKLKIKIIFNKRPAYFWNYIIEPVINLNPHIQNVYDCTFLKALFPARHIKWTLRINK